VTGDSERLARSLDLKTDVAHSARVYDYLLGGKDNFAADRAAAEEVMKVAPYMRTSMRVSRNFMVRVVRYLAAERGIRQFLDIGTGLPTSPNLHEVAQAVDPTSRVVYVDNDPMVLVHARALLTSTLEGRTTYIEADLADPETIIGSRQTRETLDFDKPIALCLLTVVHFVHDDDELRSILGKLLGALVPGSFMALTTITLDGGPRQVGAAVATYNSRGINSKARTRAQVRSFFDGLELVEPGITAVHQWRPDDEARTVDDSMVSVYGGVAIKR
jgi:hypothetical protein